MGNEGRSWEMGEVSGTGRPGNGTGHERGEGRACEDDPDEHSNVTNC